MNLSLITVIILACIIALQEWQIRKLSIKVNVLFTICEELNNLNDKHVEAAQHMVDLIKMQDITLQELHKILSKPEKSETTK